MNTAEYHRFKEWQAWEAANRAQPMVEESALLPMHLPASRSVPIEEPGSLDPRLLSSEVIIDGFSSGPLPEGTLAAVAQAGGVAGMLAVEIAALWAEVAELKRGRARNPMDADDEGFSSARKRVRLSGPASYLSNAQATARKEVLRKIRNTMKKLTRRKNGQPRAASSEDEDEDDDNSDDNDEGGEFSFDFEQTAKAHINQEIIERTTSLVAVDLNRRRLLASAIPAFEAKYHVEFPDGVLDTDYLTELVSELESSDEDVANFVPTNFNGSHSARLEVARKAHYDTLAERAHLSAADKRHKVSVWERRTKAFRSQKLNRVYYELEELALEMREKKKKQKGKAEGRNRNREVDLGRRIEDEPDGTLKLYPFMISDEWKMKNEAHGLGIRRKNPSGFATDFCLGESD
ncbi:hypothetical protein EW145_g4894 [Phellinidium pouzarii]|uniref:Uncharacterized protein n=1 Tax=Phellinidium pouzarii TaxID=167371 RepID=A0A4S4L251_9AGAM|nr:hypothetical protein EW145_g4894 [Phellinidium pouzarii]